MPRSRLLYHAIWATKHRHPLIVDTMIVPITNAITQTSKELNVTIFAVGIMPDHVHVFAQIPPTLQVARVIGRWEGASSHAANEHRPLSQPTLAWQSGYGVLSVSQSGFDRVLDYIRNQHARHAAREVYGVMERAEDV
jgi:putative transposase